MTQPPIRALRLPTDLPALAELGLAAFQYPENPTWSVQPDEAAETVDTVNTLRRLWPLVRLLQLAIPSMRDLLRGYIWEENGRPVGFANFERRGTTDSWYITTVAVLPSYRRRGIGRQLVEAVLDFVRERGGRIALLDMTAGNTPAYALYKQLGFERYVSGSVFDLDKDVSSPEFPLPGGYTAARLTPADWRDRYELQQRITPAKAQEYEPIEELKFRPSASERLMTAIVQTAQGIRKARVAVRAAPGDRLVAVGEYTARVRPGGVNGIHIQLDPAHPELAPYLVRRLVRDVQTVSPGRRIKTGVLAWQPAVIEAVPAAGFAKRLEFYRMGVTLQGQS